VSLVVGRGEDGCWCFRNKPGRGVASKRSEFPDEVRLIKISARVSDISQGQVFLMDQLQTVLKAIDLHVEFGGQTRAGDKYFLQVPRCNAIALRHVVDVVEEVLMPNLRHHLLHKPDLIKLFGIGIKLF